MTHNPSEHTVVQFLLRHVLTNSTLSTPVYCADVHTEADATRLADTLPLIYLWNEDRAHGTFSISVNGSVVGLLLEPLVARSEPAFARIRDAVCAGISSAARRAVVDACQRAELPPSVVFAPGCHE